MGYTVLARRYRSQTFDDVIGQEAVAQTLKNAIRMGRVAHAYLFSGTRGVGKTTMARILAKALNCLNADGPTTEPCCECDSCISINVGEDIDVLEIDGASNTGVDNIRQLRQNAIYRPARSRHKIYIIDEVHMLSTGAFNALLKILEEPPEHVKFIFATTEPNKVLPTIQSRCQRFDFSSISPQDISTQLGSILKTEGIEFEDDLVLHLARLANGSMRDGLSLLDQLISTGEQPLTVDGLRRMIGASDTEKVAAMIRSVGNKDAAAVLAAADEMLRSGQTAVQIVDALIQTLRDLMVLKAAGARSDLLVLTEQERRQMAELSEMFDIPALVYSVTTLEKLRWTIRNSETARALLEASLLRLTLSEHFLGIGQILSRIRGASANDAPAFNVKKNAIAAGRMTPQAAAAAPRAMTDSPGPQAGAPAAKPSPRSDEPSIHAEDTASLQQQWPRVVAAMQQDMPNNAGMLADAMPARLTGDVLTIVFPEAAGFAMMMCRNRSDQIAEGLGRILGRRLRLQFETGTVQPIAEYRPPGAKTSQKQNEKILQDPAVRAVLTGLNATVTQIDEIEQEIESEDEE